MVEAYDKPKKKTYTPETAYVKARTYCAYQERCQQEVRNKLNEWSVWGNDAENIISKLIEENFLNEERFAKAFAGGKFRIKHWGKIKIKQELKKKQVSDYCIKKGLNEIDTEDYYQVLKKTVTERYKKEKAKKLIGAYAKAIISHRIQNYCAARGFESSLIREVLKDLKINAD